MYDILIENGRIADGSGNPWFQGDIGIKDSKIVAIGALKGEKAKERLDVRGLMVSPGFIDIHTHADALPFLPPGRKEEFCRASPAIRSAIAGSLLRPCLKAPFSF